MRFAAFNQANTPLFVTGDFWSLAEDAHGGILACSSRGLYSFSNGQFTRLGLKSGLSADWVNYAIESVTSGLWVATGDGLNHRRDGVWTAYKWKEGLKDSQVHALHEDSSGRIWVGSSGGLQVFDPIGGKFLTNWPPFFLLTNLVQAIYADARGDSWITLNLPDSMGRLMRLHGDQWSEIRSNYANVDGKTLLATSDQSMHFWLPSKHWRVWEWMEAGSNRLRLPVSPEDWVSSMCEDSGGNLWVGTMDHGLFCFQADTDVFETFARGLPNPNVWAGCEDAQGTVWILAAKEALNNAARHSLASEVRIRAMAFDPIFQLSIEDNGRGFDPAKPPAGDGLPNMRARVESAGGQFLVESEPGKGTRVRMRISLKDACK